MKFNMKIGNLAAHPQKFLIKSKGSLPASCPFSLFIIICLITTFILFSGCISQDKATITTPTPTITVNATPTSKLSTEPIGSTDKSSINGVWIVSSYWNTGGLGWPGIEGKIKNENNYPAKIILVRGQFMDKNNVVIAHAVDVKVNLAPGEEEYFEVPIIPKNKSGEVAFWKVWIDPEPEYNESVSNGIIKIETKT
jgi:hypothetical protein